MSKALDSVDVQSALKFCAEQLSASTDAALFEARLLLSFVIDKPQSWLIAWPESTLEASQIDAFKAVITRRQSGEPLAYIMGEKDFWSLTLKVTKDTLIPRADTEVLVEKALALIAEHNITRVLDLGTGTGAIALAIASECPTLDILAADYSEQALLVAKQNQQTTQLNNVRFLQSDWFSNIPEQRFELIVSNPPYIAENDEHLLDIGLKYEPLSALASGAEGLDDIHKIIEASQDWLTKGGHLMLEHGYNQAQLVQSIFVEAGFVNIQSIKDYAGHERVTFAQR